MWQRATVVAVHDENPTARTLTLEIEGWPGHRPGQHVDIRLTAPDGYAAVRPYSIATPTDGPRIDLTIQHVDGGEVSSYLVRNASVGTQMDVRGPLGGWFVWSPDEPAPVQLLGGGVGVGPLMAILREHDAAPERRPMRLLYSTRDTETVLYREELARRISGSDPTSGVSVLFTRRAPDSAARPPGRITRSDLLSMGLPPSPRTRCYVCGPTGFVEAGINLLIRAGFKSENIRAERFG